MDVVLEKIYSFFSKILWFEILLSKLFSEVFYVNEENILILSFFFFKRESHVEIMSF